MVSLTRVKAAPNGTAWRTATMHGYVYKNVPSGSSGEFELIFVQRDGDVFKFNVSAAGVVTGGSGGVPIVDKKIDGTTTQTDDTIEVTAELLTELMSDWTQTTKSVAEAIRVPDQSAEW